MPLAKGSSKKVMEKNFHELRHGKTFAHTEEKFGKGRAIKQMEAIALNQARTPKARSMSSKMREK